MMIAETDTTCFQEGMKVNHELKFIEILKFSLIFQIILRSYSAVQMGKCDPVIA